MKSGVNSRALASRRPKVALPHQSVLGPLPLHREAKGRNLRTKSMNNQSLKFLHFLF